MRQSGLLWVFLAVVLVTTGPMALFAGGEAEEEDGKTTITIQVWGSAQGHETNAEIVMDLFPELAERIDVEVKVPGAHDADSADAFRRQLAAGQDIPDIMYFNYTQIPEFAEAGVLADLSELIERHSDKMVGAALDLSRYRDQYVAVPWEIKSKVWYYRKDIFEEAGIDPDEVRTLDDFIEAGNKLREAFPDKFIHNQGSEMIHYDLFMMLPVFDATFVNEDGEYIVDEDPGVRETFQFFKELKESGVAMDVMDWSPDWEAAFADGSLVSKLNASWLGLEMFLPTFAEGQEGLWAATTWPDDFAQGSDAGGSVYTVPAGAENAELAIEYLEKLRFNVEANMRVSEVRGVFPVLQEAQERRLEQAVSADDGSSFFSDGSYVQALAAASQAEYYDVFPYTPAASAEVPLVLAQLNRYINGEVSLDEALAAAQRDLESQIGDPYEW